MTKAEAAEAVKASAIRYEVRVADVNAHLFEVALEVDAPDPKGQCVYLPAWIPGSYMVRDFARHVVAVSAVAVDAQGVETPVAMVKQSKSSWACAPCSGVLRVTTTVYAYDLSVRGAWLDQTRGYFNGVCLFLALQGREHEPVALRLVRPDGQIGLGWRVATSMRASTVDSAGFGDYTAEHYQDLIDHPVELSDVDVERFDVADVPHRLVLSGRQRCDIDRLTGDLQRVCSQHHALFGTPDDLDRYDFLVYAADRQGGGLEHRFSNSCIVSRDMLPRRGMAAHDKRYVRLLALLSHEYFHLWNVKRTQPAAFQPFDLSAEQYTRTLWVFEGITSYYDKLALVRSGVIDEKTYFGLLGELISTVYATPGRLSQSIAESSFDAWIKLYKRDENAHNAIISYYSKGSLVALALDLKIRSATAGERSLDDVMRTLWQRHGATGEGIAEGGFEALTAEVTGVELGSFFQATVYSTEDPPLEELLAAAGVTLQWQVPTIDAGARSWYLSALGAGCRVDGADVVVDYVTVGGPACSGGLAAGDRFIALDGTRLSSGNFISRIRDAQAGESGSVHAFRRDELMQFDLTFAAPAASSAQLTSQGDADYMQVALRTGWLQPIGADTA
jgi:predicted metalloprotease with PDZ domain